LSFRAVAVFPVLTQVFLALDDLIPCFLRGNSLFDQRREFEQQDADLIIKLLFDLAIVTRTIGNSL